MNEITWAPLDIKYTQENINLMLNEIYAVEEHLWHFDKFRNCKMLSIMNPGGAIGKVNLSIKGKMEWTTAGLKCPQLMTFLKNNISWMNPTGRVTILRTPAGATMNEHIDCAPHEIGSNQMKWRFVLSEITDELYFLDKNLQKKFIPAGYRGYILDGRHPHGLKTSSVEKITICIGSPWKYQPNMPIIYEDILTVSRPEKLLTSWIDEHLK